MHRDTERYLVSTHSRLKAAGTLERSSEMDLRVSTHSRLKAAGEQNARPNHGNRSFNTQPPEGGWGNNIIQCSQTFCEGFNTQPPEGGWHLVIVVFTIKPKFQHTAA